jgi:uncharacterized membrane protein (DUF485 family)
MASEPRINWAAVDRDPRFQVLHRRKRTFLWMLMALAVVYYFVLPIGAAYFPALFRTRIWGPVNLGILFALSEFAVAWLIAYVYYRQADRKFDPMAEELARAASGIGRLS